MRAIRDPLGIFFSFTFNFFFFKSSFFILFDFFPFCKCKLRRYNKKVNKNNRVFKNRQNFNIVRREISESYRVISLEYYGLG